MRGKRWKDKNGKRSAEKIEEKSGWKDDNRRISAEKIEEKER